MSESQPDHNASECIALLQASRISLSYLAEGNANVVYNVESVDPKNSSHRDCCVMRLRKDLPFTRPAVEALSAFKTSVVPLYSPEHENVLLEQALYKLDETTLQQAQSILKELERDEKPNRLEKRRHVYLPSLAQEHHGVLMPNLNRGQNTMLLEFKPKWLIQSPSAPGSAARCRTCALNALRREQGKSPGRGDSGFCPLSLLSTSDVVVSQALRNLDPMTTKASFVKDFFKKVQPALVLHQKLQLQHNCVGLHDFHNPEGKYYSLAMALRDCSVFLVVDTSTANPRIMDVKFADLDLKTADGGKLERWAAIEQSLLDSGSYLTPDHTCALHSPTLPGDSLPHMLAS